MIRHHRLPFRNAEARHSRVRVMLFMMGISLFPAAAGAQELPSKVDSRLTIEQIPEPENPADDTMREISSVDPDARIAEIDSQLSDARDRKQVEPQLTTETPSANAGEQLYKGKRSAASATPLSSPSEGRKQGAAERLGDADRCDAASQAAKDDPRCATVIENRSSEYAVAEPNPLSPEQKLLIYQNGNEAKAIRTVGMKQKSGGAVDPDDVDNQSLASIVLSNSATSPPAEQPKPEEQPSVLDAAVLDLITAITQRSNP